MINIENVDVNGFDAAIRGMRNPLNSWDKSDSQTDGFGCVCIGNADHALMMQLVRAGSDHAKFMRMITVTCDITAPLYLWKEFDTYKVGTVRNSCSTMHTIHNREFTIDDFSHDHLIDDAAFGISFGNNDPLSYNYECALQVLIICLNKAREKYLKTKDKRYWYTMIQLLPSSYNQRATVQMNYAVLRNMYHARRNHKLSEWVEFCQWIKTLPMAKELICDVD